jgi:hypothetical protein
MKLQNVVTHSTDKPRRHRRLFAHPRRCRNVTTCYSNGLFGSLLLLTITPPSPRPFALAFRRAFIFAPDASSGTLFARLDERTHPLDELFQVLS